MHVLGSHPFSSTTQLATLLVVSTFLLQCLAVSNLEIPRFSPPQHPVLLRREEDVDSSCDSEGQWNCMTDSWQRCASGHWSAVVQCAEGTKCEPSGQNMEFRIEFYNSSDGSSNSNDAPSVGPRPSPSQVTSLAAFLLCALIMAL